MVHKCCECCKQGVDPDLHADPEFKGHDTDCTLCDRAAIGDYYPGWDDRKSLSEVWQGHAPLPDEGLSERVYDALIAVAQWGYRQRVEE